jgi:hypothetical protein
VKLDTAKISLDNIHTYFVRQLENWVNSLPDKERDKPFVGTAGSEGVELTPKQMVHHVRELTPLGVELFENAAALRMSANARKMSGLAMTGGVALWTGEKSVSGRAKKARRPTKRVTKAAPRGTKRVTKAAAKAPKRAEPRARTAPRSAKPR